MEFCEKENGIMCIVLYKSGLVGGHSSFVYYIIGLPMVGGKPDGGVSGSKPLDTSFAESTKQ